MRQRREKDLNISEVAKALNNIAQSLNDKQPASEIRIQWAAKLQDAANLVLGATVLSRVFASNINILVTIFGVATFISVHLFAYVIMSRRT